MLCPVVCFLQFVLRAENVSISMHMAAHFALQKIYICTCRDGHALRDVLVRKTPHGIIASFHRILSSIRDHDLLCFPGSRGIVNFVLTQEIKSKRKIMPVTQESIHQAIPHRPMFSANSQPHQPHQSIHGRPCSSWLSTVNPSSPTVPMRLQLPGARHSTCDHLWSFITRRVYKHLTSTDRQLDAPCFLSEHAKYRISQASRP